MKTQIVIFGLTGDLGKRKLLPSLDYILNNKSLNPEDLEIIGISRREVDAKEILETSLGQDGAQKSLLAPILSFHKVNLADLDDYIVLKQHLRSKRTKRGWKASETKVLFYLSVPPTSAAKISELLGKSGLNSKNIKILFEKPFGIDLASAEDFFDRTSQYFSEKQILRVDHYLMKTPIRALQAILDKNQILRDLRSQKQIKSIVITAYETLDIEGRAIFYEQTGALRDFVQNHLASILATILSNENSNFRAARAGALENINNIRDMSAQAKRAQYKGYRKEVENPNSNTETFSEIHLNSSDKAWQGVNFILRHGKAMAKKQSKIEVEFTNKRSKPLLMNIADDASDIPPYAQVFLDAVLDRRNFFVSQKEILESWRIFDPVLKNWAFRAADGLEFYSKSSPAIDFKH